LNSSVSQEVVVYQGSFLDFDWSDGDLVFANSTCFDDKLMMVYNNIIFILFYHQLSTKYLFFQDMSKKAELMRPGAFFVTFTKGLSSKKFEVLEKKRYKMSWGPATVFIHRRLQHNGTSFGPVKLNILPSDNVSYDDEEVPSSIKTPENSDDDEGNDFNVDEIIRCDAEESQDSKVYSYGDDCDSDDTVETSDSGLVVMGKAISIGRETKFKYENLPQVMSPDKIEGFRRSPGNLNITECKLNIFKFSLWFLTASIHTIGITLDHSEVLGSPQDSALLMRKRATGQRSGLF
jgi:hypothetical protein